MDASLGERKIHGILERAELNYKMEVSFEGLNSSSGRPLRFDFIVYDEDGKIDAIIEFQGKQHYEPSAKYGGKKGFYQQQFNDNKKRRFCAMNNLKLVEIPYTDLNLINYDYLMNKIYDY